MVADSVEVRGAGSGPALLLGAMLRAMRLEKMPWQDALPVAPAQADAGDQARALLEQSLEAHRPDAVLLVGARTRRALDLRVRMGEVGTLSLQNRALPAMVLPSLTDISAAPWGKAAAWRALCALAEAR